MAIFFRALCLPLDIPRALVTSESVTQSPGQAVALMGPSGCGKTTLLNILGGVDHASGGEIQVGEPKLISLSERDLEKYRLHKWVLSFNFLILFPRSRRLRI